LAPDDFMQERDARSLPSALDLDLRARLRGREVMVFLDYDGTLCPIVERPEDAYLSELAAEALHRLAQHCPVAVLSGRDLWDVREKVGLADVAYAGSHGFDFMTVDGAEWNHPEADRFVPILNRAESELRQRTRGIAGAQIERKRFSLSAHYRRVGRADLSRFEVAVLEVIGKHPGLHHTLGKMVHDLRPAIDWDKGKALQVMRARLLGGEQRPGRPLTIYIGDDRTDEDAFAVLGPDDIGIVLAGPAYPTRARHTLADSDEVRGFLGRIADVLQARSAAA
jgi:trehalose-phosphatase